MDAGFPCPAKIIPLQGTLSLR